ncbi:alpha/beta fold hydrolase [Paludisphaera mucosa]|uniref:Alpha/beta fold hydrolase n=1 Tax=Paludisphaera mucosa TaxID=3030827 RepID=A0ABT6FGU4_9BACT|nr:alpha/beta fold hydrolase [Paludisphaera mucosa]MDG3006770.1 alpha/beta fold hydrolase [Paludisphaera mucosa]
MEKSDEAATPAGFKHQQIAASGVMLHAVETGAGPLMVLVSGWPQTWYSWRKVMPRLAERFHVVAVDLPGLGESDPAKGGHDTGSIALHLDPILDAFDASDCRLVTHDVGAWVGYAYAARRPERVRNLTLIDGAIPGLASQDSYRFTPETAAKTWHFAFNYVLELPEMLIAGRERAFLAWLFRTKSVDWAAAFDEEAIEIYARAYAAPGRWSAGLAYYRSIFDSIAQNRATAAVPLAMPVLAIGAEACMGAAMGRSLGEAATDVQGVVIDRCGHYVAEERPDALLDVLLPFCLA